ncbi:glycosyl Hydrolase Family 88 [Colletotrichum graminicola M1.001]|uniref:Glycosyl Hydrolase Family 88 n=1 Tax=Colletotrichum graminicola (strain M1.001 / M2 / FGSC 10212) TaxID=645133 RepID=E3QWC8_COLGM|nr:glycosyl Hydrolase Family 88 [Colletotrichum graminicola M1.001]EFQ35166.1 glycosyl Hydrolase Family 88 [Colletotrichum graminicola M1.001]
MKPVSALLFLASGAAAATVDEPLAGRTIDSWIRNNNEAQRAGWYGRAALYTGVEAVYELTRNETLLAWYRSVIDGPVVAEDGSIPGFDPAHYSLDDYRIGRNILYWHQRTTTGGGDAGGAESKYRAAADAIRAMLDRHPRTPSGGFWHRDPVYRNQMWLDGIYMADTFYAHYTSLFDAANATAWDDIVLQWDLIEAAVRDPDTGLLFHGFDEGREAVWADAETGASPLVWNRAVGWYFMSLVEILDLFPRDHPGHARLLGYYTTLAAALRRAQDPDSHGWWLVMNGPYPGREGNYLESSAAAMFTWGWLAGLRLGYLDEATYLEPATKAYTHLVTDFVTENGNGTVTFTDTVQVGSLNSDASFEYYIGIPVVDDDTRGVGPFLLAAYEWELRNNITA